MTNHKLVLHYAPRSRASTIRVLLDELGAEYDLKIHNVRERALETEAFLAINPLGKVPVLQDGETIITESVAIALHAADLYSQAGLTPASGDSQRGNYLRWMVFYAESFEPAVVDKAAGFEMPQLLAPYCSYDKVMEALAAQLRNAPYILGDRFSVVDILWGSALRWTLMFDLVPDWPVFADYAERITGRPSFQRVFEEEAALAAVQDESVESHPA
ncbi:glutathione S-transferase [Roseibium hamelinense]|uniref:Glutathione S-transferase n=1 Tax=Roseibium hamelinense TaxID=150831 RepID=A0A562SGC6_9HYPH|nr:glutathione S-transferase family protein [Roseibium hamelinense]MTI44202.1 glutathione S-transferase family protein [Roseibium hamelinense]TWI80014.1 glutathione S-transferase [Roseibium hamelinense]